MNFSLYCDSRYYMESIPDDKVGHEEYDIVIYISPELKWSVVRLGAEYESVKECEKTYRGKIQYLVMFVLQLVLLCELCFCCYVSAVVSLRNLNYNLSGNL
uniref:Uncharacterized protein n=1 Tax=Micrurus lemniscatus lemniscatus TaxID=129467 RepID=A0A2D4I108_MICLE